MATDIKHGKEYRKWLRDNNPGDVMPCPLNELINAAVEDEPFNNSKGTWPTIINNWLPHLLDTKQYRYAYDIMVAAFQHTNATEDQKQWPNVIIQLPPATRRAIFKKTQDLLINATRVHKNNLSLPMKNMIGLYSDTSWIEPIWFNNWSVQKTLLITSTTANHFSLVAGSILQSWLSLKSERDERLTLWLQKIRQFDSTPSFKREALMLLPNSWSNQLYDHNVSRNFLNKLSDGELHEVTLCISQAKWLDSVVTKDIIAEWMKKENTQFNWLNALRNNDELTVLGNQTVSLVDNWNTIVKDKYIDKENRIHLLIAIWSLVDNPEKELKTKIFEIARKEKLNENLLNLVKDFNLKSWDEIKSFKTPDGNVKLPSLEEIGFNY